MIWVTLTDTAGNRVDLAVEEAARSAGFDLEALRHAEIMAGDHGMPDTALCGVTFSTEAEVMAYMEADPVNAPHVLQNMKDNNDREREALHTRVSHGEPDGDRQPRERAVPCRHCHALTLNVSGFCDVHRRS